MYLQLKQNKIFINPDTGQEFDQLVAGIKNINITVDEKRCTFLLKMFLSRDLMLEGKNNVFQEAFTIENTETKTDFSDFYMRSTGDILGIEMEKAMYDFILSRPGFEIFELKQ